MNLKKYRDGQEAAHRIIKERIIACGDISAMVQEELHRSIAERYTAIVLPTRYGKSDVIRCSAIDLFRNEYISAALVLSPNRVLRNQMVDPVNVDAMFKRYQITGANELPYRALDSKPADLINPTANGEFLVSATMQLVHEHIAFFEQWVESMLYRHHAPVVIYIDECHTGSEWNLWGHAIHRLVAKGACAVLLTATPMRADGARIPGFDFIPVEVQEVAVRHTRASDDPNYHWVDLYAGTKTLLKLQAHHTTTFTQAWDESPKVLCRISRLPFDVELTEMDGRREKPRMLSALTATEARQQLGRIIRQAEVVSAGAQRLVNELRHLHQLQPDIAAIVFVGNDLDSRKDIDAHAKLVRSRIEDLDSSLDVVIATSSDGNEGTTNIERFARGRGDVLIVKQMASLGLDIPRLKVALDLSPIRTAAGFIQRVMRIATPYPPAEIGTLIIPADCLGFALFETLISAEGGEARVVDLELVESYLKLKEGSQKSLFSVESVTESDFDDSHGVHAAAALRPSVDLVVNAIPELLGVLSHAQIAERIQKSGLSLGHIPETSRNTGREADDIRLNINELAKQETMHRLNNTYDQVRYAESIRQLFTEIYSDLNLPIGTELGKIADVSVLQQIKRLFLARIAERQT